MAEPTQVVNTTTSIPDYARPYVEQLLGMTGGALYNYEKDANGQMVYRDAKGAIVPAGTAGAQPTPTGLQNYQPYTGERTAGYSDLQKQAYATAQGLGYNPYSTGAATGLQGLAQRAGQYAYTPSTFDYTKAVAPSLQNYQMTGPANVAAQQVSTPSMAAAQTSYDPRLQNYQMGPAQQVSTGAFTAPGTVEQYMSPYQQAVTDIAKREAQRQADIAGTTRGARAAQSGAFGGSRQAIENAEAQRNLAQQMADIQAKGGQEAYNQAAQMFTSDQARQLAAQQANQAAGLTVGQQNLASNLGVQQLGTQTGLQTALANLTNQQQQAVQNQAAQLQTQGLNAQQALQAALANQQMGYNVGSQNLQANLGVQQLGSGQNLQAQLANQTANQQMQQLGEQSKQYGAGLGLQGLQAGMSGYQNLGAVGQNLYGQNIGNLSTQAQLGGQQQQQVQNILNQQYQDFLTQQQFPYQQLSYMSNMLRGVPLSQGAQTVYQQPPSTLSQVAGAGLSLAGLSNLFGGTSKAKGGKIEEKKGKSAGLPALVLSKMG